MTAFGTTVGLLVLGFGLGYVSHALAAEAVGTRCEAYNCEADAPPRARYCPAHMGEEDDR